MHSSTGAAPQQDAEGSDKGVPLKDQMPSQGQCALLERILTKCGSVEYDIVQFFCHVHAPRSRAISVCNILAFCKHLVLPIGKIPQSL